MSEASEIIALTPTAGAALAEKARSGAPVDVRRYALWCAWRAILADRVIPQAKKRAVFADLCRVVEVEVVPPDDPEALAEAVVGPGPEPFQGAIHG